MHLFIFSLVQSMKLLITTGSFLLLITAAGAFSNNFVGQKFHSPEMNIKQLLIWCTVIPNRNVKNKIFVIHVDGGCWLLFLHQGSYIFRNRNVKVYFGVKNKTKTRQSSTQCLAQLFAKGKNISQLMRPETVWPGLDWYGLVWSGMAWDGMV